MLRYKEQRIISEAQKDKKDRGKLRLSLVPLQIIRDVAAVRQWATENKYPDVEGWKNVSEQRYIDALLRHLLLFLEEPEGVDEESGLPHWSHVVTNAAFISELRRGRYRAEKGNNSDSVHQV